MKMRITIEIERDAAEVTDRDMHQAVGGTLHVCDVDDAGTPAFVVDRGGPMRWSYVVETVKP